MGRDREQLDIALFLKRFLLEIRPGEAWLRNPTPLATTSITDSTTQFKVQASRRNRGAILESHENHPVDTHPSIKRSRELPSAGGGSSAFQSGRCRQLRGLDCARRCESGSGSRLSPTRPISESAVAGRGIFSGPVDSKNSQRPSARRNQSHL